MKIRRARPDDLPNIAVLQAASWKDAYRDMLPADYLAGPVDEDMRRHWADVEIKPEDCVLVAEDQGKLVGFIAVFMREEPFIDNLHTDPAERSKGVGAALLRAAAAALLNEGRRTAYLHVITENKRALAFYERLGGEVTQSLTRDVFGHPTPHYKIEWRDLSVVASSTRTG